LAARSGDRPAKESPAEAGLFWWPHAWVRSLPAHNAETRVWFRGFVQYAREGLGSGKDTRASPHPCVVTQEVRSGALCAPASAAVHERHSLRSLGARPYRERSKRPQCDTAGDHRRGFVHPRKSPAETGPIRAARLEEYHPAAFNFIPKYVRSMAPKKKPRRNGGQVGHVACKLAGAAPPFQ
jgi:hypothetical protein